MKRWIKWAVAGLIVLLIVGGVLRALGARKAQQQALAASSAAGKDMGLVELAATDVAKAQVRELVQGLPVSGSLKAVNSCLLYTSPSPRDS